MGAAIVARPPLGTATLIAGQDRMGFEDGPALSARFRYPMGMVKTGDGALVIVDFGNDRIRRLKNGVMTTLAGGDESGLQDGPGAEARFRWPRGIALDEQGRLLVRTATIIAFEPSPWRARRQRLAVPMGRGLTAIRKESWWRRTAQ